MSQNIYNEPAFFAAYNAIPRSVGGLQAAPEWPYMRDLVGSVTGARILDLGCGYGWFSRWAVEKGAVSVHAIDISERMLEHAKSFAYDDSKITYECASLDAEDLQFDGTFDLAYSSLCFDYLPTESLNRLFGKVSRVLKPGGRLIFSVPHPMVLAPSETRWKTDEKGQLYWPVYNYLREGERVQEWLGKEDVKMYHRTMETYVSLLLENGFAIKGLEERWDAELARLGMKDTTSGKDGNSPYFLLMKGEISG